MRKELDDALCAKYPDIFKDRRANMRVTAMCWGFECGDGWYNIIDRACALIMNWHKNNELNRVHAPNSLDAPVMEIPVATQVKEKYGSLRFYYVGGDEYARGVIDMAEAMSAVTCEVCGKPGSINVDAAWYECRCPEHV